MPKTRILTMNNLFALEDLNRELCTICYAFNLCLKSEPTSDLEEMSKDELLFMCLSNLDTLQKNLNTYFNCLHNEHDFDY